MTLHLNGLEDKGKIVMMVADRFDFERFESLESGQWEAARNFLLQRHPVGSDAKSAAHYVESGGAKCIFGHDRGQSMYYCTYIRPGHGLMALVSSIEWKIIIITDKTGTTIQNFGVGREVTGP